MRVLSFPGCPPLSRPRADHSRNGPRSHVAHVRGPSCACKLQRKPLQVAAQAAAHVAQAA
eukprot:8317702-Alexandrium_andersonii.AAC.1